MEHLKLMLFPDTPLHTLLAIRPMAMNWLEKWEINPYCLPSARLEDLCRISGLRWDELLQSLQTMEIPDRASDWANRPLYHLIDFLTQEHRAFLQEFIPAILSAFTAGDRHPDFLGPLHPLIVAWPGFSASLIRHISEEESFLFPKILQQEYCLRHGGMAPDFSKGSVRVFAAVHLMREEQKQLLPIQEFLEALRFFRTTGKTMEAAGAGVNRLLQAFHHRLMEHSRMEREILFPLAGAMEKQVYDRFIEGQPAGMGHVGRSSAILP
ncbi:MAG: hemerythrin domain-containing protein [Fibrobacteria bacterium]